MLSAQYIRFWKSFSFPGELGETVERIGASLTKGNSRPTPNGALT
jgi:hypothetical protein